MKATTILKGFTRDAAFYLFVFFLFLLLKRQLCLQRLIKYGSKTTVDTSTGLKSKIPKFLQLEIQILFMDMDFIYKGPIVLSILCLNIHLVFVLFVMNI